jgi:hypothetical protein
MTPGKEKSRKGELGVAEEFFLCFISFKRFTAFAGASRAKGRLNPTFIEGMILK